MENHLAPPSDELAATPSPASAGDMALFIDWENMKISLKSKQIEPNMSALLDGLESNPDIPNGRLVIARAYADWSTYYMNRDQTSLYESGVEPVFVPSIRRSGEYRKNSVDVKIAVDCMEVSYSNNSISTYILVSGDADYLHIANSLRSRGKRVLMVGVSGTTSSRITSQRVDDLFFCEDLMGTSLNDQGISTESSVRTVQEYMGLVVDVLREEKAQNNYPVLLSYLGDRMRRRAPGVSYIDFGFPKMKALLMTMQATGRLRIEAADLADWAYLPGDEDTLGPRRVSEADGQLLPPETDSRPLPDVNNLLTDYPEVATDVIILVRELWEAQRTVTFHYLKTLLHRKAANLEIDLPNPAPPSPQLSGLGYKHLHAAIAAAVDADLLKQSLSETPSGPRRVVSLNADHPFVIHALEELDAREPADDSLIEHATDVLEEDET